MGKLMPTFPVAAKLTMFRFFGGEISSDDFKQRITRKQNDHGDDDILQNH